MEIMMKPADTSFVEGPAKVWPVIPERALVDCEVVKVELRKLNPEFRAQFNIKDEYEVSFRFRVIDGDYKGQPIFGTAKPYLNDSDTCRLRFWLQELLGVDSLPSDFSFKFDENNEVPDLVGLQCQVLVKNRVKQDGTKAHAVAEVLRSPKTRAFPTEDSF